MAKKIWGILINTFLVATESSYRLAVRISTKHDAALQAAAAGGDVFFTAMYGAYHTIHQALVLAYNNWDAQGGTQESQSLNLAQLLRLLSGTKIEKWMTDVKVVYDKTTIRFKELFPDLRKAFQQGTQLDKINAVKALSIAIGTDAALATVKTNVDAFYLLLNNANTSQKGSITTTSTLSDAVETARVNSGIGQFADYGGLIQRYAATPEVVGNYFDEAGIRKGNQVLFHHHVKKEKVYTIAKHTFVSPDELLLENEGDCPLTFALVLHKGDMPGTVFVTVAPHADATVVATALTSDLVNNHYLICYNASAILVGEFIVEFL